MEWLERVAKDDPKGAIDCYTKVLEYYVPKLARQEVTGKDGEDIAFKDNTSVKSKLLKNLTDEQIKLLVGSDS